MRAAAIIFFYHRSLRNEKINGVRENIFADTVEGHSEHNLVHIHATHEGVLAHAIDDDVQICVCSGLLADAKKPHASPWSPVPATIP